LNPSFRINRITRCTFDVKYCVGYCLHHCVVNEAKYVNDGHMIGVLISDSISLSLHERISLNIA